MVELTLVDDDKAKELFEQAEHDAEVSAVAAEIVEEALEEALEEAVEEAIEEIAAEEAAAEENDDDFEDTDGESETEKLTPRKASVEDVDEDDDDEDDDEDDDDYEEEVLNETLAERIVALKAVVPPAYRNVVGSVTSGVQSVVSTTFSFTTKALWVVTTSALLLGVPLTLSVISEQQLIEMEKEMRLTQSTNEVLAPGAESGFQQAPVA